MAHIRKLMNVFQTEFGIKIKSGATRVSLRLRQKERKEEKFRKQLELGLKCLKKGIN